jgi:pyruvate,water dikinase
MLKQLPMIDWFEGLSLGDIAGVGGKNASLGEMVRTLGAEGIRVPPVLR